MKLNPEDLRKISDLTLEYYNRDAEEFWEGTRDHDVSQNIEALLRYIEGEPPFTILDFGCGPGRDLKVFVELGHLAVGLEGAPRFAVMARVHSGCEVWQQDFLKLDLPDNHFDGVFANAALFHVPSQELPRVLRELYATLKPRGVVFAANPHGHNEEGWNHGRYGAYYNLETWRRYMLAAGFGELTHFYRPAGFPRKHQPWLASAWRRLAS
jgi:SAM-dependent methyltransferase